MIMMAGKIMMMMEGMKVCYASCLQHIQWTDTVAIELSEEDKGLSSLSIDLEITKLIPGVVG
jgi:hypothetical protein